MLAHRLGLRTVVTHPVYYLEPGQAALQRTLAAMRLNLPLSRLPASAAAPPGAFFVPAGEVEERHPHFPAALQATAEIAERCRFELPLGVAHMPAVPLPPGLSAAEHLRRKAYEGARRLYGRISARVRERLDHELEVIASMGFEPVFLIVEEILDFARADGRALLLARLGGFLAGGALPGHHQPRPAAPEPVLRALPQPGPHHPARYRYRPVLAPAGRGHPACLRHLRRGAGGHGGDDQPLPAALGAGRCGQGARPGLRRGPRAGRASCRMPSGPA